VWCVLLNLGFISYLFSILIFCLKSCSLSLKRYVLVSWIELLKRERFVFSEF